MAPENKLIENLDDDLILTKLDQIPALNILVIDDVSATCELIEQFFQDSKHQVFRAVDGEQGIALARELHPNLILLDLRMPIMSGEEVTKILKSEPQTSRYSNYYFYCSFTRTSANSGFMRRFSA
ncbi:MAG: response regulator [Trichodesmium sp. MO_231.B1]|nr:response regulator [Trichodesmium sp. MO_231.B1]